MSREDGIAEEVDATTRAECLEDLMRVKRWVDAKKRESGSGPRTDNDVERNYTIEMLQVLAKRLSAAFPPGFISSEVCHQSGDPVIPPGETRSCVKIRFGGRIVRIFVDGKGRIDADWPVHLEGVHWVVYRKRTGKEEE